MAVNLPGDETTRNTFYFHHSCKFSGYFSQAYSNRKGTDVWNFNHFNHIVRKRAASSHCLPWNHTSILYLKSDFYLNEYKQSFQMLLLLLSYGYLGLHFYSHKFCHHQNVNFLFTPEFSLQHTLFQTTVYICLHKSYGKHLSMFS